MNKGPFWAAFIAAMFVGSAAMAELEFSYIDIAGTFDTDNPNGRVEGDLSAVGEVTLYDGNGGDLWNGGDSFTYLRETDRVTGDFTATVRAVSQTEHAEGRWGKSGPMVRADLTGNAANVMPSVYTGTNSQIDNPENGIEHRPVDARVNGRLVSGENGGGFERPYLRDGASFQNNFVPADLDVANQAWLRVSYKADTNTFVGAFADDVDGAPGEWAYTTPFSDVEAPADGQGWYVGLAYSAHNSIDTTFLDDEQEQHGITYDNYSLIPEYLLPESRVSGNDLGSLAVNGSIANASFEEGETVPGLTNYFYNGNIRGRVEGDGGYLDITGRGESLARNPGAFGPVINPAGLWSGSNAELTLGDVVIPKFPEGTFTEDNQDNYAGVAVGQIWVPESGEYTIVDGIDDFTMVAVDLDGNGVLDGLDSLTNADVAASGDTNAPIGDVVILDDDWVGTNGSGGNGDGNNGAYVEFEGVAAGGEWRDIEFWMGEAGGGDAGVLYFGLTDDFDPLLPDGLDAFEQEDFIIRPDQIQTTPVSLTGGDSTGSLGSELNYIVQVSADGNDSIAVDDLDGILGTTLDVSGATVTVDAAEGLADGTEFKIFDADSVIGVDSLTLNLADESQWDLSRLSEGILVFGTSVDMCNPNTMGDATGDGMVAFDDFLILSTNFSTAVSSHTEGDFNCDGMVAFDDFLILSTNFGQAVGAQSVPEPSGIALLGLAGLAFGCFRRRRS